MAKTVNAKLYKIQDSIIQDRNDNEKLIEDIVHTYNLKTGNKFSEIELSETSNVDTWFAKLYIFTTEAKPPHWQDFLSDIVQNEQDLDKIKIQYSSFVLFIYSDNSIFVISKGYYGHFLLEEYIDTFFGLEVLSRLVNKNSTEIKQIEERGLFGTEIGSQRYFRENYNLAFEDDFGKIYKTMLASIEEDDFEKLGIIQKRTSTKKLSITGSSSLEVSSNFTYEELVERIIKIQEVLETDGVEFNQFYRLPTSELNPIKDSLNENLLSYAYSCYINNETIDFYSPNVFEYLRSTEVRFYNKDGIFKDIQFCSSFGYINIMNELVEKELINVATEDTFVESLQNTFGHYRANENEDFSVGVSLDQWFCGEVEYDGKKYFKLDSSWYLYRHSLEEHLNSFFVNFDFENNTTNNLESWTQESEGLYNESYKNRQDFIVGDRAYLNLIEMADIIKVTGNKIYFYHVKKGLGQDTRALISQINNAARYLTYFKDEENNAGLKSYYKSICDKHYNGNSLTLNIDGNLNDISEDEFIQLFKSGKKFAFVFVYCSDSPLSIKEEIINTKSRIAKLSLVYIIRDMKRTDFELLFERIKTT
ncbi:uncharacterized protein (TIGR04141 family) [Flavobacterium sp. 2755]|uniref:DUF6119 family protein n=1 Tax=Flavobacterium sp. 2755 TaxID=2817765 RepID=UPI00285D6714|nr:DUF6119 family protein [Flavobacterium sp. 2755]MDR6764489.1 uncharacterized protein (TIGR04141 family) [Flavobacterium sp. 2755]